MIAWRRDIHQIRSSETAKLRTAALVAAHLNRLGHSVRERVAHTGVVAVLTAASRARVALRADMDALPVTEEVDCRSPRR